MANPTMDGGVGGKMKVSTFASLILFTVTIMPTVVFGHCDEDKHAGNHPHCTGSGGGDGGGDKDTTVIGVHADNTVSNSGAPVWAPTDTLNTCVLQKGPANGLSGAFPRHDLCATLITTGDALTDDIIIIVNKDKRGNVLWVQVQGQDLIGDDGIVYISDELAPISVVNNPDGTMVIHVDAPTVRLYKCDTHLLKKKSVCNIPSGIFALHDLLYTSVP